MTRDENRGRLRCAGRGCRTELSMRKHTFFYGSMLKCSQILLLGYLWLLRLTHLQVMTMTGYSSNTITAFFGHFRCLVGATLSVEDQIIGGTGIIVEIDETKLGKRKYHRGHRVDGAWVLVGVERTPDRRVFLVHVSDRSSGTLLDAIAKHVAPGSIIHTDMWKGYSSINASLGLEHYTVNHSKCFKDATTGVHTNTVEGTNNGLKYYIHARNRTADRMEEHLLEFVWRRRNALALWEAFIIALRDIHYDIE
jgi:transposase-like protein